MFVCMIFFSFAISKTCGRAISSENMLVRSMFWYEVLGEYFYLVYCLKLRDKILFVIELQR